MHAYALRLSAHKWAAAIGPAGFSPFVWRSEQTWRTWQEAQAAAEQWLLEQGGSAR